MRLVQDIVVVHRMAASISLENFFVVLARVHERTAAAVRGNVEAFRLSGPLDSRVVVVLKSDCFLNHGFNVLIDTKICQLVSILLTDDNRYYKILI